MSINDNLTGDRDTVTGEIYVISGNGPDYGSGPYLQLLVEMVRLAIRDLSDPRYSQDAREWLRGHPRSKDSGISIELIAEAFGIDRSSEEWMILIAS